MRSTLIALFVFITTASFAQDGYNIKFKVQGLKDTTVYLAHYYSESTYLKDTARVNSKGEFTFDGKKALPQGVYMLVLKNVPLFEFVISQTQRFSFETKTEDYIKNMKVTGDLDNKLFFEDMIFNMDRHLEAEPLMKIIKDSTLSDDKKKEARESFSKINDKVTAHQKEVIAKHPTTLTARIFKTSLPVNIPDAPKKADGTIDSTFQLKWYREHFFDNFDLADDALIRMRKSIYAEKINEYLDKLYAPQADTITKAINKVIALAKKNQETYKYSVFTIMRKYQEPEIMGLDEVYVNLYDKYVATGEMDYWMNATYKKNVAEYANRLRKSLVGKTGANLIMQDLTLKPRSMYDIKSKYTILFIFDPDCGHCRKETPVLVDFYNKSKTKLDVEVFAVSADTSLVKMKDFIKEFKMPWITVNGPRTYVGNYQELYDAVTTPALYILDRKHKIIGKKVPVEKLDDFLTQYEKFEKAKSSTKL
ncbi:MAG TPA: thioredoxin-like domain-containing protein [Chryseolinea sp.]|nr:thioredoxin-like domain-containing protein [Chryseolinea sp.]